MAKRIIMYSARLCSDCQKLKAFMDANNITYETRDICENLNYGKELEENTGKSGVPYLVIDGEWIRGYHVGEPFSEAYARQILGLEE